MFTKYDKAIVGAIGALLTWAVSAYPSNHYLGIVAAVLTVLGVYQAKNKES